MLGRVLVVEDDPDVRGSLATVLTEDGYAVAVAADGVSALDEVTTQPPDVVVLDLTLPRMDGWQFLGRLRARPGGGQVPVLIVSGSRRQDWDPARLTGVLGYLPKPF